VYRQAPDYMREGGSIPVTLTFAEALNVNVLLLPMGRGDDGPQYVYSLPQQGLLSRLAVLETVRRMKS
jgi:Cys-Gly metallodipeptidase DUG1